MNWKKLAAGMALALLLAPLASSVDKAPAQAGKPEPFLGSGFTGTPKIEFQEPLHSFGRVQQGMPVNFKFTFKNVGTGDLVIIQAKGTCGCTAALASTGPYHPGETGFIDVTYDSRGKFGSVYKDVRVESNDPASPTTIALEGMVMGGTHPAMAAGDVLFQGSCAECHSIPAKGKSGKELYEAVCAICHDPSAQAPAQKHIAPSREALAQLSSSGLEHAIAKGVPGSSMPGFGVKSRGPLDKKQIKSLLEYLKSIRSN